MTYLRLGEIIGNPSSSEPSWANGDEAKQLERDLASLRAEAVRSHNCFHMLPYLQSQTKFPLKLDLENGNPITIIKKKVGRVSQMQ